MSVGFSKTSYLSPPPAPMPQLIVCGVGEVANVLAQQMKTDAPVGRIISITDPLTIEMSGSPRKIFGHAAGKTPIDGYLIEDWMTVGNDGAPPITSKQIENILSGVEKSQKNSPGNPACILVHCTFGVSRSAAVAYGILFQLEKQRGLGAPAAAEAALDTLYQIRPSAVPNPSIVKAFDAYFVEAGLIKAPCLDQALTQRQKQQASHNNLRDEVDLARPSTNRGPTAKGLQHFQA